jgi:DNA polymerase-1
MSSASFHLINRVEDLAKVLETLEGVPVLGLDLETTGLDPHTSRARLLQLATSETSFVLDLFQLPRESLGSVLDLLTDESVLKVAHNAKFDAKFLLKHYGIRLAGIFDTYLASQLVSAGSEVDRHSLEAVAQRYLGVQMDKTAQTSDWSGELLEYQLEYAARDASTLIPLQETLEARLDEMDLKVTARLEFDCILPIADMELVGVFLDQQMWRAQVERVKAEHRKCADALQAELARGASQLTLFEEPTQINLDSPQQVRDALARIGIDVEGTSEWRLHGLADEYPVVKLLLAYRGLSKSLTSYGEGVLEFINPATGRIHADFRQIGTPSGRITCSSPSLQQVPHAPEYRSCFRSPSGRRLVVADFSQIEMRILADFSRDSALISAFRSGADLHRATASQMLSVPLADVTPEQRAKAKGLNYGIVYGMGAEGLANRIESTVAEAELLIQRYFKAYPLVDRWLRDAADRAVNEGRCRTASGRLWIFQLDPFDRQQAGQLRRVGKNAPIQGTASDIFKRAMTLVDECLQGMNAAIVNSIHDEIVVECDQDIADVVAQLVRSAMESAGAEFLTRVPVVVDVAVADAWLKT